MICLLLVRDGRDEIHERSMASAAKYLPDFDETVIVNDHEHKLGFAGAIQRGWEKVQATGCDYVFHLELDFLFSRRVPVGRMIQLLDLYPHLAQVSLKRQPVNAEEQAAGGIVERDPENFWQKVRWGEVWTEHRLCFTTNPSVYSTALLEHGWPQVPESEGMFSHRLMADPDCRFAFWGPKDFPAYVEHIGEQRMGHGY